MTGDQPANPQPVVKPRSLTLASLVTIVAVVAALVAALALGAQKPTADEAALRALLADADNSTELTVADATSANAAPTPTATVGPEPDPTPAFAAPTPIPTSTPAPTPPPATPTPQPPLPTPVPTTAAGTTQTRPLPAGRVTVPVGPGVSFVLPESLETIHLPGISALYPSAARTSEVDIFVPVATADGRSLVSFDDVVNHIETDPLFASLVSLGPANWNGIASFGFFGYGGGQLQLGFTTDPRRVGDLTAGWFLAAEVELWVLDTAAGPIVVTGESLAEASDAEALETLDLMIAVLSSLEIAA